MRRNRARVKVQRVGVCRLCGRHGPLSREHVPPRSAFNKSTVRSVAGPAALAVIQGQKPRLRIQQGGTSSYAFCGRCNNVTGKWYVPAFTAWVMQSAAFVASLNGAAPSIAVPYHLLPLRVLKEVVTMFLAVNSPAAWEPKLGAWILSRGAHPLPAPYRVYVYFTFDTAYRHFGWAAKGTPDNWLTEITHRPLGYVMTRGAEPPHVGMAEITDFGRYGYDDYAMLNIAMPLLRTVSPLPGDYKSERELAEMETTMDPVAPGSSWFRIRQRRKSGSP